MIRFAGSVKGRWCHPFIYAIVKNYCMYIGETQHHPAYRWGQHLSKSGTFSDRLKEVDEEIWRRDEDILFISVDCVEISKVAKEEHKLISQYVEHKVHEHCILNLPMLSPIEKIISDTSRSAPAMCRHSWGDELALRVYNEIVCQLNVSI